MKAAARWSYRDAPPADDLARALNLPPVVARILAARGFSDPAAARRFLDAPLDDLTPAAALPGLEAAADLLLSAAQKGERVTVYGDYDADGVCATAILIRTLAAIGADARPFLPHRMREGYGLAAEAIREVAAGGARVLLTVDCGVGAVGEIALARSLGLRTIVLDHHEPPPALPDADVLVDLKTQHEVFGEYCAAGLAWRFAGMLRARAGLPASEDLLELAAIATIADVVPLVADNRILVRHGLARLARSALPGMLALMRISGVNPQQPGLEREIAWRVAPRLNAAGRIESAERALALLLTDDAAEASRLAAELDDTNRKRQEVHDHVLAEAHAVVVEGDLGERPGIVVWGEGWHPGVVGIAAGRLREAYHRPVVLLSVEGDVARGSARGIPGLNLVDALHDSRDLLDRYGGHAAAAGVSLPAARLPEFRARFEASVRARVADEDFTPQVRIDADVPLASIDETLASALDGLRPFGPGNPEPTLMLTGARLAQVAVLGNGEHLRLVLTDGASTREAIAFGRGELGDLLLFTQPRVDVAFHLQRRFWQSRTQLQCVVEDLRAPDVDLGAVLTDAGALVRRLFDHRDDYLDETANGLENAAGLRTPLAGGDSDAHQAAMRALRPLDPVALVREPGNATDPHAVRVEAADGRPVGYVPRPIAGRIAPEMDRGVRYRAGVASVADAAGGAIAVDLLVERVDAIDELVGGEPELLRLSLADDDDDTLLRRLSIHLLRGHSLDAVQQDAVRAVMRGERRVLVAPPGGGAWAALIIAAAARALRGAPAVLVFPTVEMLALRARWWRPQLASVGIRAAVLHGLLGPGDVAAARALLSPESQRGADVLFTTAAAWTREAPSLPPLRAAALIGEGWTNGGLPPFAIAHGGPVLWTAWTPASADGFMTTAAARVRTNLRIADRRGKDRPAELLAALAASGERVLAYAASAREAVAIAAGLRDANPARADRIAYDHDGLPARVRETLYGLLAAGRLHVLVCDGAPGEEARITGVRHVVWMAMPDAWQQFLIQAASAGAGREELTLHVALDESDARAARAQVEAIHPPRTALAAMFRVLRALPQPFAWPDDDLARAIADAGGPAVGGVEAALRILEEAGVILARAENGRRTLTLAPDEGRRDLMGSIRYEEGEASRRAFEAAARRLLGASAPAILEAAAGVAGSPLSDAG